MAKKPTVLQDADILTKVLAKSRSSVNWTDSKLSRERERVTNYLNGVLPKRQNEGSSSYVSSDVYDSVESQRTQLLEVFAAGDHIAEFDPDQDMNADQCRIATEYASYVIFRQNEGYNVFGGVIYDGLTARAGVAKIFWEEKYEYSEETFGPISYDDAHALASQEDVDEFDADADDTGAFSGNLVRKKDVSKVTIVNVAPEEFLIEPLATSIFTATYVGHRTPKTKAELIDMGFNRKKVMALAADEATALRFSPEVIARTDPTRSSQMGDDPAQDELAYVVYFESYIRIQLDPAKGVRLYKMCHTDAVLLDKPQEVDKAPFLAYVPLPVPHVFYGNNFAQRVIPTQNARTVLFRGVLDHTAITTNPRYFVVNGGLMNPRELLDNRLGGVVNVRRPDSVTPMQQNNLNPYVFQTLTLLTDNNEKSTGISALSQGLNKDAISTQNSKGLVDNMVKASGGRGKIMARNFAYNFFIPLMLEVIRLSIIHEDKQSVLEVAGAALTIDPRLWTERKTCSVSMHLGYGEKDIAVQKHTEAYKMLKGNPLFKQQNEYELIRDTMKLAGLNRAPAYISVPDQTTQPQPDPLKVRELDIKDKMAQAALQQASNGQQKDNRLYALDQSRLELDGKALQLKTLDHDRTHDRQDAETTSRIQVADAELDIEREALKNEKAKIQVSASANPRP